MKVYKLPVEIKALVFDMDLTLYTHEEYGRIQVDNLVAIMADIIGISFDEGSQRIKAARQAWEISHNGKKASLSDIVLSWGFTMEDNVRWREKAYEPEKFLNKDETLRKTLMELSGFTLGVVTNNPVLIADRTLKALGVDDLFSIVVGLDTCMAPKPHKKPFQKFIELSSCTPENCVSIGDRFDIDLDQPLEMGMGAIQVDGVEDVYELPGILLKTGVTQNTG